MSKRAIFLNAVSSAIVAAGVAAIVSVTGGPSWACAGFFVTTYLLLPPRKP